MAEDNKLAMIALADRICEAGSILNCAIDEYRPTKIFALLSGGHDSLTATAAAYQMIGNEIDAVVHIDTGIGIPETQQFVIDVCAKNNWPLLIYRASFPHIHPYLLLINCLFSGENTKPIATPLQ